MARKLVLALVAATACGIWPAAGQAHASTIKVTTTVDELVVNRNCSLREAIRAANLDVKVDRCAAGDGADTIKLGGGTYVLSLYGPDEDAALSGDLDITSAVTLSGHSAGSTSIDASGFTQTAPAGSTDSDRVIDVLAGGSARLRALTVRGGGKPINAGVGGIVGSGIRNAGRLALTDAAVAGNFGGGILNAVGATATLQDSTVDGNLKRDGSGPGIDNEGTASLDRSEVTANASRSGSGMGIFTSGTLTLSNSTVSGNHGGGGFQPDSGSGIANTGTLHMSASTISANTDAVVGGGLGNSGTADVTASTIDNNGAFLSGGGIDNSGTLTLSNSTVSANTAIASGAIANSATMSIVSSTITTNTALGNGSLPGPFTGGVGTTGLLTLANSILAGNTAPAGEPPDCSGTITSLGYNLIGDPTGCTIVGGAAGDQLGAVAMLGPLAANGGPTRTHALLAGSPAIDAGNPRTPGSGGGACPTTDQRGTARPQDGDGDGIARCDIGAFERSSHHRR